MSDEERRDSLADQAAAWIPPWERPTPPRDEPAEPPAEPPDEPAEPAEASDEPFAEASAPTADLTEASVPAGDAEPTAIPVPPEDAEATAGPAPTGGTDEPAGEGAAAGVPRRQPAPRRRATPAPEPAPVLDDAELRGALEAILLVVDEPVSELVLAQVLEQPAERVGPMLDEIAAGYTAAGHGFELRRAAGGWRLYTRPEYATYVERFVLDGQSVRLTQAALETLAVIAYKQPVTRSRISAIRGVNCDGVIRTLVSRGLVEECGTEPDSGAFLYRTTTMFLEKLGLNSVDDLPPLAPFLPDDVEELADATR
ncbi:MULTISPECIES: SMC-Scp complex subunit ScpB [unclassified Micromonospora]|uniref:SMC-Scp complex subunit ScpB n=1 Tax=unclassified Micromonospora TaxID=2617518 RepID=UPI002FF33CEB